MEGPSLVILREELQRFVGEKVLKVAGNTKQPKEKLQKNVLTDIRTWGKNLFLFFESGQSQLTLKIHFLMWGSYRIDDPKTERRPRLQLKFKTGTLYIYTSSIRFDGEEYWAQVDPRVDLMSAEWDRSFVVKEMKKKKSALLCDLFLDQSIFAGSGNIVKNEVLFNLRKHPSTPLGDIPQKHWTQVADAVRDYCWNFYKWKKKFELRKHWQVYRQTQCPVCHSKIVRENTGKFARKSFYCPHCQAKKGRSRSLSVHAVLPLKKARPIRGPEARLDH
jgi:endonuclease VIII